MRVFSIAAVVAAAVTGAMAQSPSSGPSCSYTCPDIDLLRIELLSFATLDIGLSCTYDAYTSCTYDSYTGVGSYENDATRCPGSAQHSCHYKRFNVVRELAQRRAAAAAQPATSVPDVMKRRAALKKRRVTFD